MTSLKSLALTALAGLAIAHGAAAAQAGERASELRVKAAQAISLNVGAKRAIGYYLVKDGSCKLTLMIADSFDETGHDIPTPVRVTLSVDSGTSSSVEAFDGPALAFSCASGANELSVQNIQRVAVFGTRAAH